jgi:hypothetical protein
MGAAMQQSRIIAFLSAFRQFHGFLGIEMGGERRRISLFLARSQRSRNGVEYAQHFDRVHFFGARCGQRRTVVKRIEQTDHDKKQQHRQSRHAARAVRNTPPRREQMLLPPHVPGEASQHQDQQPDQHVGDEDFRFKGNVLGFTAT